MKEYRESRKIDTERDKRKAEIDKRKTERDVINTEERQRKDKES
jgi:hypothetical protein